MFAQIAGRNLSIWLMIGLCAAIIALLVIVYFSYRQTIEAYPLGATPLGLLLSRDIRIDKGVEVGGVIRRDGGFSIMARDSGKHRAGQIALDFTDQPIALAGWTITTPQGGDTRVRLVGFAPAGRFPASLFELGDPTSGASAG